jgi:hypothetical protein
MMFDSRWRVTREGESRWGEPLLNYRRSQFASHSRLRGPGTVPKHRAERRGLGALHAQTRVV